MRWWSASTVATASSAPAPPSRWPVIDLVLVTTTSVACAPSVAWSIRPSAMSPCGVEVAWALTWAMSVGLIVAPRRSARRIARAPPRPCGVGLGDVVGVGGDAGAEDGRVDPRAAGLGVLLGLEHQHAGALAEDEAVAGGVPRPGDRGRVAAPSPLAVFDSAIMLANAAIGSGWIAASVPPATHDVGPAEPDLVDRVGDRLVAGGARRDRRDDRRARADVEADVAPPGALGISIGTASGETRRGPFSFSVS